MFQTVLGSVAIGLFAGGLLYAQKASSEKAEQEQREAMRASMAEQSYGRPAIGGPFQLVLATTDEHGHAVGRSITHQDLLGRFALIYFGFTNCPDICPEELEKMASVVTSVQSRYGDVLTPVFISCDPRRDTIEATAEYAKNFHPDLLALTGHPDDVKQACKAYRVYFSMPSDADGDYLVDHSIFFYLMDPEGRFVEVFGRSHEVPETRAKVLSYIKQWKDVGLPLESGQPKQALIQDTHREVTSLDQPLSSP